MCYLKQTFDTTSLSNTNSNDSSSGYRNLVVLTSGLSSAILKLQLQLHTMFPVSVVSHSHSAQDAVGEPALPLLAAAAGVTQ